MFLWFWVFLSVSAKVGSSGKKGGKTPDMVIELLSDSTRKIDKREKKQIYQDRLRVPEYFWYDPFDPEDWAGFALRDGVYEELKRDAQDRLISQRLGLAMVPWQGVYKGVETLCYAGKL